MKYIIGFRKCSASRNHIIFWHLEALLTGCIKIPVTLPSNNIHVMVGSLTDITPLRSSSA